MALWLSTADICWKNGCSLAYEDVWDDILRTARPHALDEILDTANSLHPSLNFTIEQEVDDQLPFLDMCV